MENLENKEILLEENLIKNKTSKIEKRVIGLDLFKIFCSIMITIRHFIRYNSVIGLYDNTNINQLISIILNVYATVSINGFILITGFFLVKSKFRLKRIFSIWGETFFFSVLFFLIGYVFKLVEFRPVYALFAITPILSRHYWFPVGYLVLCLISPILNKLVKTLTKREYLIILICGAILFSAWTTFVYYSDGAVTGGHTGILWMIYLYLVGGFFSTYQLDCKKLKLISSIVCIACVLILTAYQFLIGEISFLNNFPFLADDSIFALLLSVSLFILFKEIGSRKKSSGKFVSMIASCSFGVYLIQENCMIRDWLWFKFININTISNQWYMYFIVLGVVLVLFILSFMLNRIFQFIFALIYKIVGEKNGKVEQ